MKLGRLLLLLLLLRLLLLLLLEVVWVLGGRCSNLVAGQLIDGARVVDGRNRARRSHGSGRRRAPVARQHERVVMVGRMLRVLAMVVLVVLVLVVGVEVRVVLVHLVVR